jgi:hypothetical protein
MKLDRIGRTFSKRPWTFPFLSYLGNTMIYAALTMVGSLLSNFVSSEIHSFIFLLRQFMLQRFFIEGITLGTGR